MNRLRLAMVVHGRFFVFDLARELIRLGHEVTLFTNYPKRVCERFGIPRERVVNFLAHGVASRALMKLFPRGMGGRVERWCNTAFGRWAARAVPRRGPWDAVACMSGVAEELFHTVNRDGGMRILFRASAHIRSQRRILDAEAEQTGIWVERPTDWIVGREEREYRIADRILVSSSFTHRTFLEENVPGEKVAIHRYGVDVGSFRGAATDIESRCSRVLAGAPIRVLNVGTFSLRKGARVWQEVLKSERAKRFEFRFVGAIAPDATNIARQLSSTSEFLPKIPQFDLPTHYAWGDVFVLPTLEDGFPVVLTQALASGVPIVCSPNSSGPDLIREGVNGWVTPAGDAGALIDRLEHLDRNRGLLATAVREAACLDHSLSWRHVADEYVKLVVQQMRGPVDETPTECG